MTGALSCCGWTSLAGRVYRDQVQGDGALVAVRDVRTALDCRDDRPHRGGRAGGCSAPAAASSTWRPTALIGPSPRSPRSRPG